MVAFATLQAGPSFLPRLQSLPHPCPVSCVSHLKKHAHHQIDTAKPSSATVDKGTEFDSGIEHCCKSWRHSLGEQIALTRGGRGVCSVGAQYALEGSSGR
mmetsp:Transcript_12576/g.24394  ORF Transcript_12576/g.24394 Transcript_12576/m.24394 type:complete len:100 (-) Transcript_12576:286-585(-)